MVINRFFGLIIMVGVILGIFIFPMALMTFPGLSDSRKKVFEAQRRATLASAPAEAVARVGDIENPSETSPASEAVKEWLRSIEADQAEAAIRFSMVGRIGCLLNRNQPFSKCIYGAEGRT